MRKRIFLIVLLIISVSISRGNEQLKHTINNSWSFIKDNSITDVNQFLLQLDNAELVNIPHTWNDKDVIDENDGFYRGAGWYYKEIRIPTAYSEKEVFLYFEGVATKAEVYINGKLAKTHVGGFTRFTVPVSPFITFDDTKKFTTFNVAVKADNSYNEDWPPLHADFTFFGGMYRDVNLVVTEKVHFDIEDYAANGVFITTPNVSEKSGDIDLKVRIKNDESEAKKVKLITRVYAPDNKVLREKNINIKLKSGISNVFEYKLKSIENPHLWSPDSPSLYRVVCEIVDFKTEERIDETSNSLGFRWFKFDVDEGFFLNGKHLKLIGTCHHQDFDKVGNAVPDHIFVEDVIRMKKMGSNFLRIAHYPQDPAILEMCDRLGIITTIETPIIDLVTESEAFSENCLSAHKEMIRQNFNHPSLIIWAYMNEILLHPKYTNDKKRYKAYTDFIVKLAKKLDSLSRAEDPYRYTMIPNHNSLGRYKNSGLTEVPMIVGWNIYNGWYGGGYETLESQVKKIHESVKKPMIITEYGAGADPRIHTLYPTRFDFSQEYEVMYHNHYLNLFKKLPYISGANVWNYADFNSEGRIDAVESINNKGLIGIDRKPKEAFYYYQASLLSKPFVAIGTKTWGQRSNVEDRAGIGISTMPVNVYTNQKEIELFLNGKSLGTVKSDGVIAKFDVPFINGVNKLRAINKSNEYCEDLSEVRVNVLPVKLDKFPVQGISVSLGDKRFFYDDQFDKAWTFDREYTKGSWGHIGGKPYVIAKKSQQPYGTKQTIKGTPIDPVYQTQLIGIDQYRFDVPEGVYEVRLHFAELQGTAVKHLPYDLSEEDETVAEKITSRTFSVLINDNIVLNNLDILNQYGEYRAVNFKYQVTVGEEKHIIVSFKKIVGEPVLNAIELYKKM